MSQTWQNVFRIAAADSTKSPFWQGMGSVLQLWPSSNPSLKAEEILDYLQRPGADADSLRQDWQSVGCDLRRGVQSIELEINSAQVSETHVANEYLCAAKDQLEQLENKSLPPRKMAAVLKARNQIEELSKTLMECL